jgi:DNA-binding NarL/FixJ family response regulator
MVEPAASALRVALCDDSAIFRGGLQLLLEKLGVHVIASVSDVAALFEAVSALQPDVAVVDVRMPPTHTDEGIRAAVALHRDRPSTGVMVLSTYVDPRWAMTLLHAVPHGVGYLLKDRVADAATLLDSLRRVAAGGVALDPDVVAALIAEQRLVGPLDGLTEREIDVLSLLAEGRSNTGIAQELQLSVKTVETHIASIFRALRLQVTENDNRRVKAALTYLSATHQ